ncbi:hypothetical protein Lser_V15G32042 [Lactuca serriola]
MVEMILEASANLGIFQVVNHGIPVSVMDEAVQGVCRFHEQDDEVNKGFYTRDISSTLVYNNNYNMYSSPALNWRDTFFSFMAPSPPPPEELPEICRDIQIEYSNQVMKFGGVLFRLFSEALGLNVNHLGDLDCGKGLLFSGHFYPACPQQELTMGTSNHTDDGLLAVLLQDQIGGLQIRHQNQWTLPFDNESIPNLFKKIKGLLMDVYRMGNCEAFNLDLVRKGFGGEEEMLTLYFNKIGWPTSLPTNEKGSFMKSDLREKAAQPPPAAVVPPNGPNSNPLDLFPQGLPDMDANGPAGNLDFLRNSPYFKHFEPWCRLIPKSYRLDVGSNDDWNIGMLEDLCDNHNIYLCFQ